MKKNLTTIEKKSLKKVFEIEEIVAKSINENYDLMHGKSGEALFYFNLFTITKDLRHKEKGEYLLQEIVEHLKSSDFNPTFCSGLAGICWLIGNLSKNEFIDIEDDFFDDINAYLITCLENLINEGNLDFLHGALGIVWYFINNRTLKSDKMILKFVINLDSIAIKDIFGTRWQLPPYLTTLNPDEINLGLAHGIPAYITILSFIHRYEIEQTITQRLTLNSIKFLLACEQSFEDYDSCFPAFLPGKTDFVKSTSRLAWCYGDLGISWAMIAAAGIDKSATMIAQTILTKNLLRREAGTGVIDGGLCHGSSGVALLFGKFSKYYQDAKLHDAATNWISKTLELDNHSGGLAGYKKCHGELWLTDYGLLDGISGIGLSLISYLKNYETNWEECLLIG